MIGARIAVSYEEEKSYGNALPIGRAEFVCSRIAFAGEDYMSRRSEEIQAVLDTLYLSKNLNWDSEQSMWFEAKQKHDFTPFDKLRGRYPKRFSPASRKVDFDKRFWSLVMLALSQAEMVRKGKKAIDVYPISACVVTIQRDHYGIEFYLGKAGDHFVDGFPDIHAAHRWAKYESKEYLREKGVPEGTKLLIVGDDYY